MLDIEGYKLWLSRRKSESTIKQYVFLLQQFEKYLGKSQLNATIADKYLLYLQKHNKKNNTISLAFYAIMNYFTFIHREAELNNIERIRINRTEVKTISKDDVNKIIKGCLLTRDKAIISLLYSCALRIGELVNLDRDDIDWRNKKVLVRTLKQKNVKYDKIPVDKKTIGLVKEYLNIRTDNEKPLFLGLKGRIHPDTVRYQLDQACNCAGLDKIHPHILRHSRATNALRDGVSLPYLQKFLRHKFIQSTMIYTHITDEDLEDKIPAPF